MATVTHYIYSHYDPKDRETLEHSTGQHENTLVEDGEQDPWQTESAFGVQRRLANAPQFVPAIVPYDEINEMMGIPALPAMKLKQEGKGGEVAGWYRSLTRGSSAPAMGTDAMKPIASGFQTPSEAFSSPQTKSNPLITRDKNNWFITRALRSEPPSVPSTPPSTLADILSREPPPSPMDRPFTPPVFLAIGPSNRGFTMLQRSGWNEGETLGAHVLRRGKYSASLERLKEKTKPEDTRVTVKEEEREIEYEDGEVTEVRRVEVVDLTLSDEEEVDVESYSISSSGHSFEPSTDAPVDRPPSPAGIALLTPIPTVLKSDRLGIGLKAKTQGPYKASRKRVTHNQAALAAHIRANEELQRMKKRRGRGTGGFARLAKADAEHRRQLLASLNLG